MICTTGLSYTYPQGPTLAFPDVSVPQGSVLLLSGPSGCGKSTWLALVAALVRPTGGTLYPVARVGWVDHSVDLQRSGHVQGAALGVFLRQQLLKQSRARRALRLGGQLRALAQAHRALKPV